MADEEVIQTTEEPKPQETIVHRPLKPIFISDGVYTYENAQEI